MKSIRLILLVATSSLFMFCQSQGGQLANDWEEHNLRGAVSTIVDTAWLYDSAGRAAADGSRGLPLVVKETLQFNEAGMLTFKLSKRENGNSYQDSLFYNDGLLVKTIRHRKEKSESVSATAIQYDSLRRKITVSYSQGRNVYHYEGSNTRPSMKDEYVISIGEERHARTMIYTYDSRGNVTKTIIKSGDTGLPMSEIINEYDRKGNKVLSVHDISHLNITSEDRLKYNSKGDVIEKFYLHSDWTTGEKRTYEYQYDQSGNWVVKEMIKPNGDRIITRRTITYFK